jgi:transcription antitermination factor NusG
MRHWFALQVKTKHERVVANSLVVKEMETFSPVYEIARYWKDRVHEAEEPLFPGYVFCRFDAAARLQILMTPGVLSVVSYGRVPARLEDEEIAAIQAIIASRIKAEPWPYLQIGNHVRIEKGPLAGLTGILVRINSSWRFVVSVNLLQRSVAAEVDALSLREDATLPLMPRITQPGGKNVLF